MGCARRTGNSPVAGLEGGSPVVDVNSFAVEGRETVGKRTGKLLLLLAGLKDMLKPGNRFWGNNVPCNAPLPLHKRGGCMSAYMVLFL